MGTRSYHLRSSSTPLKEIAESLRRSWIFQQESLFLSLKMHEIPIRKMQMQITDYPQHQLRHRNLGNVIGNVKFLLRSLPRALV
jgi:hypothetical protein